MTIKYSVVIPIYNESKRLEDGLNHFYGYLKNAKFDWELIFVNDGSKDNTLDMLRQMAKNKKNIKVITYKKNGGKGYAICQGVKNAKGQRILFTDLDHSVPVATLETFDAYFEQGYKVVIGSRRVKGAKLIKRQPLARELLGRGFTLLVNLLIYWGVADSTCGFKAFENQTAQKIFNKITVYGWAFDAEIIYICKKLKIKFAQAPVQWSDVRGSKVSLKKDIFGSLKGILKIRQNDLKGLY